MQIDKNITTGNIVSWSMIMIGLAIGYGKLQSATAQTTKDAQKATEMAAKVEETLRNTDAIRLAQISALTVDIAVTKSTVTSIDKKIDELIRQAKKER